MSAADVEPPEAPKPATVQQHKERLKKRLEAFESPSPLADHQLYKRAAPAQVPLEAGIRGYPFDPKDEGSDLVDKARIILKAPARSAELEQWRTAQEAQCPYMHTLSPTMQVADLVQRCKDLGKVTLSADQKSAHTQIAPAIGPDQMAELFQQGTPTVLELGEYLSASTATMISHAWAETDTNDPLPEQEAARYSDFLTTCRVVEATDRTLSLLAPPDTTAAKEVQYRFRQTPPWRADGLADPNLRTHAIAFMPIDVDAAFEGYRKRKKGLSEEKRSAEQRDLVALKQKCLDANEAARWQQHLWQNARVAEYATFMTRTSKGHTQDGLCKIFEQKSSSLTAEACLVPRYPASVAEGIFLKETGQIVDFTAGAQVCRLQRRATGYWHNDKLSRKLDIASSAAAQVMMVRLNNGKGAGADRSATKEALAHMAREIAANRRTTEAQLTRKPRDLVYTAEISMAFLTPEQRKNAAAVAEAILSLFTEDNSGQIRLGTTHYGSATTLRCYTIPLRKEDRGCPGSLVRPQEPIKVKVGANIVVEIKTTELSSSMSDDAQRDALRTKISKELNETAKGASTMPVELLPCWLPVKVRFSSVHPGEIRAHYDKVCPWILAAKWPTARASLPFCTGLPGDYDERNQEIQKRWTQMQQICKKWDAFTKASLGPDDLQTTAKKEAALRHAHSPAKAFIADLHIAPWDVKALTKLQQERLKAQEDRQAAEAVAAAAEKAAADKNVAAAEAAEKAKVQQAAAAAKTAEDRKVAAVAATEKIKAQKAADTLAAKAAEVEAGLAAAKKATEEREAYMQQAQAKARREAAEAQAREKASGVTDAVDPTAKKPSAPGKGAPSATKQEDQSLAANKPPQQAEPGKEDLGTTSSSGPSASNGVAAPGGQERPIPKVSQRLPGAFGDPAACSADHDANMDQDEHSNAGDNPLVALDSLFASDPLQPLNQMLRDMQTAARDEQAGAHGRVCTTAGTWLESEALDTLRVVSAKAQEELLQVYGHTGLMLPELVPTDVLNRSFYVAALLRYLEHGELNEARRRTLLQVWAQHVDAVKTALRKDSPAHTRLGKLEQMIQQRLQTGSGAGQSATGAQGADLDVATVMEKFETRGSLTVWALATEEDNLETIESMSKEMSRRQARLTVEQVEAALTPLSLPQEPQTLSDIQEATVAASCGNGAKDDLWDWKTDWEQNPASAAFGSKAQLTKAVAASVRFTAQPYSRRKTSAQLEELCNVVHRAFHADFQAKRKILETIQGIQQDREHEIASAIARTQDAPETAGAPGSGQKTNLPPMPNKAAAAAPAVGAKRKLATSADDKQAKRPKVDGGMIDLTSPANRKQSNDDAGSQSSSVTPPPGMTRGPGSPAGDNPEPAPAAPSESGTDPDYVEEALAQREPPAEAQASQDESEDEWEKEFRNMNSERKDDSKPNMQTSRKNAIKSKSASVSNSK